jgi:hypothetical protein
MHLKEAADSGNGYHEVENVRAVFGLLEEPETPPQPGSEEPAP